MAPMAQALLFAAASVASAFVALFLLSLLDQRRRLAAGRPDLLAAAASAVFLFEGQDLIDATPAARRLLGTGGRAEDEWGRLQSYLRARFPGVLAALADTPPGGEICLPGAPDPNLRLRVERPGQTLRLTIEDMGREGGQMVVDCLSARAQEEEIGALREILGRLPLPVWRTDDDGAIQWTNDTYLAIAGKLGEDEDMVWPLPALFDLPRESERGGAIRRASLVRPAPPWGQWFDCHVVALGSGFLHLAMPADRLMKAEAALKDFVQTLTKTFAHLSVGLAIFDAGRRLALFNPALTDLTSLGPDFLTARPTLPAFLDRLREARILPEPRDYASWRQKMSDLEKAATAGSYEETWVLPGGQTYRVTGRPHPDGALAFLIEDITAEISLTRRFRSEIEFGQSVMDALDEAVAVFSPSGELVMSNAAYAALWGSDPQTTLGSITIIEATRQWQSLCQPSPAWGDLRDFVGAPSDRAEWAADLTMTDGRQLSGTFAPLPGGATLVRFARLAPGRSLAVRHSRRHPPAPADAYPFPET
ncbi:MAG: PAS-domain containing protein [Proteobacteria bacterium]|nr:PAS-domain containing protein [Pseudomonadota bacterium]MBS0573281.1 PAS-domain containing protein [Pseudomonadota bacterium]